VQKEFRYSHLALRGKEGNINKKCFWLKERGAQMSEGSESAAICQKRCKGGGGGGGVCGRKKTSYHGSYGFKKTQNTNHRTTPTITRGGVANKGSVGFKHPITPTEVGKTKETKE